MVVRIDSTKFSPYQLYIGLHKPTHTLKSTFTDLRSLWSEMRENKDYDYADRLRDTLRDMEWSLLWVQEIEEAEIEFNKDRQ